MTREAFRRTKHKSPKFKDSHDEDFDWQDKLEIKKIRGKIGKKPNRRWSKKEKSQIESGIKIASGNDFNWIE